MIVGPEITSEVWQEACRRIHSLGKVESPGCLWLQACIQSQLSRSCSADQPDVMSQSLREAQMEDSGSIQVHVRLALQTEFLWLSWFLWSLLFKNKCGLLLQNLDITSLLYWLSLGHLCDIENLMDLQALYDKFVCFSHLMLFIWVCELPEQSL